MSHKHIQFHQLPYREMERLRQVGFRVLDFLRICYASTMPCVGVNKNNTCDLMQTVGLRMARQLAFLPTYRCLQSGLVL